MKKTLFILTLGFCMIFLSNCSRGYGCYYTSSENQNLKSNQSTTALTTEEAQVESIEITAD